MLTSGFNALREECGQGNERLVAVFHKLFPNSSTENEDDSKEGLTNAYHKYKRGYLKHLSFDPSTFNRSKSIFESVLIIFFSAATLEHAPLEVVYIYFDTATYDEIERDEKVMETFFTFF